MPHATDDQDAADDALIAQLFIPADGGPSALDDLLSRELEVGEKAEDAIDYADIDDDDLADSEDEVIGGDTQDLSGTTVPDSFVDGDDDLDDLFGDGLPSSPVEERQRQDRGLAGSSGPQTLTIDGATASRDTQLSFRDVDYGSLDIEDVEEDPVAREQREMLEDAKRRHALGDGYVPPPLTNSEIFEQIWPDFQPDKPPRFSSLIPQKKGYYPPKLPLKPPRPIQPTKVNLDIATDQERTFKLPATNVTGKPNRQMEADQRGIIHITKGVESESEGEDDMELDDPVHEDDQEMIGNVSWNDLKIACEDWEIPSLDTLSDEDEIDTPQDLSMTNESWMSSILSQPPKKKRKAGDRLQPEEISIYHHNVLSFDDPEVATAKLAKKIVLDMNDPHLLLDVQQPNSEQKKPRTTALEFKRDGRGSLANPMFKRYNISNDEAYDALKENHQHKVRSTLSQLSLEHSLPALKLQYPFYKVNLSDKELRSFHRPQFICKLNEKAHIEPLHHRKRKHVKVLKPQEAFQFAVDLSMGDNSDFLLAEYSEEYPTTLSNFGMANKIINYYRRKDNDDNSRPKRDLGETNVLLPQDKSPFSTFGMVEPGQTVPTLHNAMYRAPVFQHTPKQTDFLVCRSHTGVGGDKYYMRNLQNLVIVGQEFPSVEVPGTHARKVTEASKRRLKMLSFRLYRKGQQRNAKHPWVSNEMIKYHLPGTEIAQNRSRMREIMNYDKDKGTWNPKDGEVVPDEATLRTWIKPEDICLIDSMHAGDRHLMDVGYNQDQINANDDDEDGDESKFEMQMAPWNLTKNFLNACQGKAMLQLHGKGDPTGRGEAFSFVKVSMKGGYKDAEQSVHDKMDAKKLKELGGHSYNVAKQQREYENAIKRIWNKQSESLSSTVEHDIDDDVEGVEDRNPNPAARGRTPRSEHGTPAAFNRDDETMSQFSKYSNNDGRGKVLRIRRWKKNKYDEFEQEEEIITDRKVIKEYRRRKEAEKLSKMKLSELKPTGDAEFDLQQQLKLKQELARLTRNVERREGREKAKAGTLGSGPGTPGSALNGTGKGGSTPRKCAGCGQMGHIKTNKKLCPLLNGQMKQSDTFKDATAPSPVTVSATPTIAQTPGSFAGSPQ